MSKKRLTAVLLAACVFLSGCAAHVDTASLGGIADCEAATFDSVSFQVPTSVRQSATDYFSIINAVYPNEAEQDSALTSLIQTCITGTSESGYLLTSAREHIFYVSKCNDTPESLMSLSRDDILNLTSRADLTYVNYGRLLINEDETPKAVLRVDFRVLDARGEWITYSGYLGVAIIGSQAYYYLAGYASSGISSAKLKQCFDIVRSMS